MAMKVNKSTIHRISVDMSCGCKMFAEFEDPNCKRPLGHAPSTLVITEEGVPPESLKEEDLPFDRSFTACDKHEKDAAVSMLEFIIGERLDEAVESARKAPPVVQHLHSVQSIEAGESGGVVATGDNVQVVQRVNRPEAVGRAREIGVKVMQRSPEQLVKSGAALQGGNSNQGLDTQMMDEAPESPELTRHVIDAFNALDGDDEE